MKSSRSLIIVTVAVVLALLYLSSTAKKPPVIPPNAAHKGITTQEGCTVCHAPGKSSPLKETHPPKEQCLVCHKAS